jgi:hypothetical protein
MNMADRFELVARKQELRRKLEQLQCQLEAARLQTPPPVQQIRRLEQEVERLMAEEYSVRIAIDQSR